MPEWWHKKTTVKLPPHKPPPPPSASKHQVSGSNHVQKQQMRYKRGTRVQVTDAFDHRYFNDVAEYIEELEDRIAILEKRTGTPCASCDGYATENDFLCSTCRGGENED